MTTEPIGGGMEYSKDGNMWNMKHRHAYKFRKSSKINYAFS